MNQTGEIAAPRRPRIRAFQALADRNYRLLWIANFLFYQAQWMDMLVLGWLVVDMTGSPLRLAVVFFVRMGLGLYISIAGGVLLDRFDRRKLVLVVQLGNASMAGIMAFLLLMGWLQFWHILPIVLGAGIFGSLDFMLRRTLVSDVVKRQHLTNALALEASALTSGMAVGPLAGGLIIDVLGAGYSYLTILFMFVACFFLLSALRTKGNIATRVNESLVRSFIQGIGYVVRHPVLLPAIAVTLVMNMFVFTYAQFLPVFAKDILMIGPAGLGVMGASVGLGAFTGTLIQAPFGNFSHRGWVYLGGSTITTIGALLFAASEWFSVSLATLFLAGLGLAAFHSMQGVVLLSAASDEMRGRVMSILMFGIGGASLGVLMVGAMASVWGTPLAVRVSVGIGFLLFAAIAISFPKLRRYS